MGVTAAGFILNKVLLTQFQLELANQSDKGPFDPYEFDTLSDKKSYLLSSYKASSVLGVIKTTF